MKREFNCFICSTIKKSKCLRISLDPSISLEENSALIHQDEIETASRYSEYLDTGSYDDQAALLSVITYSNAARLFIFVRACSLINATFDIYSVDAFSFFISCPDGRGGFFFVPLDNVHLYTRLLLDNPVF